MIQFNGIRNKNKIPHLVFKNEQDHEVEIPVDKATADRFSKYLDKLVIADKKIVERGNDEDGD